MRQSEHVDTVGRFEIQNVLVTGANGLVGSNIMSAAMSESVCIRGAVRKLSDIRPSSTFFEVGDINGGTDWAEALNDVDVVVHAAARVHVMNDSSENPLDEFRKVNVEGTLNLARQAMEAGCKRFVYLSSIKVNGEATTGNPFTADDIPQPQDPYAVSKHEAEQGLLELVENATMDVVIIRPPLVYGLGVKANFKRLANVVSKGVPLPLANIQNKRSLVGLANLVSFIEVCMTHPEARNQIFVVSDGDDLSTSELIDEIAKASNTPARNFPAPALMLKLLGKLLRKEAAVDRLIGSLQVDIEKNKRLLLWEPPFSIQEQLKEMFVGDEQTKQGLNS